MGLVERDEAAGGESGAIGARTLVLGAVLVALLLFWRLGALPLLEPDEGRYTEIPREMLATHDFVTPRLDGVLYFEKPPLVYWINAAAIALFGLNETAARLGSAACAVGGLALAYLLGAAAAGRRAGAIAAAALGTMPYFVALGRLATTDMTLTFCLTATLTCFWLAQAAADPRRARRLWLGAFAGAALALLAKGLIGVVIPGAIVLLWLLATGRWEVLRRVPWAGGTALLLAIAAPWHVLAALRNPDFLWFYFVHEHLLRYLTPVAERREPVWFFLAVVGLGCAPWSGLIPSALRLARDGGWRERARANPDVVFLALWAGFVIAFFSISQSKLIPYALPAAPPLAVLIGRAADRLLAARAAPSRLEAGGIVAGGLAVAAFGALFVVAGLGGIDRPGLTGVVSAGLLVPGAIASALALATVATAFAGGWRVKLLVLFAAAACVDVAVLAAGPVVARERSCRELARTLRASLAPGDAVFSYRDFPESLPVYLGRTVGVAGFLGELTFGASHLDAAERAARFPDVKQFASVWRAPGRVWLVVARSRLDQLDRDGVVGGRLVAATPAYALLVNR